VSGNKPGKDVPLREMGEYEIREKEVVWEGRFLRTLRITYGDHEGRTRQWEAVERVNCAGIAAIIPVTDEGEALLIRQFRPSVNNYVVEFPAGLNDRNENIETVALRELLEETGYDAREMIFLARGPISSGLSNEILTVFLAKGLSYKGTGCCDETENIEVIRVPFHSIYERLAEFQKNGDFVDVKIFGFIEIAKRHI
jgi:8-oxo-dGTP pyrophosphatase MutT (NUDIX family)